MVTEVENQLATDKRVAVEIVNLVLGEPSRSAANDLMFLLKAYRLAAVQPWVEMVERLCKWGGYAMWRVNDQCEAEKTDQCERDFDNARAMIVEYRKGEGDA